MFNSFKIAFAMYSKIPMPKADWTKEKMGYVMCFFPLIGIAIGTAMGVWYWLGQRLAFSELFSACGFVLIPLLLTGGIHMDGYLDTIDARHSYQSMERKLEILKDSHTGAFAIIYGGIYLVASLGAWSSVNAPAVKVLAVSFVFSRALSGFAAVLFKGARKDGMLATFSFSAEKKVVCITMVVYALVCAIAMIGLDVLTGLACVTAGFLVFGYYRYFSYKEFGGVTGDLAGYFVQVCELMMALAAAAVQIMTV